MFHKSACAGGNRELADCGHMGRLPRAACLRGVIDELEPQDETAASQTVGGVIAEIESACAASRQIAAGFALDQTVPHDQLGPLTALCRREHHQ